jgi:hypothetical protein
MPRTSPRRGQSLSFLMMLAPLALMLILFQMRLGVLKRSTYEFRDGGHFILPPTLDWKLDDADDDWFGPDSIDED